MFDSWDTRFCVLTNAGLLYFPNEKIESSSDLVPQNFKPLNDFVVVFVNPDEVKGRKNCFRVIFSQDQLKLKPLTLMAPTEQDMREWVRAMRLH